MSRSLQTPGQVWQLAILRSAELASAQSDHKILIWDLKTGKPVRELVGHSDMVTRYQK